MYLSLDFALEIVVFFKGWHLDNGDGKVWVIVIVVSTKGALYTLQSAFTYLDDKYLIRRVQ